VVEEAMAGYAAMGYLPAASDGDYPACASNGGDGRLDVYLVDFKGADGAVVSEQCQEVGAKLRCAGYILAENDFTGGGYGSIDEAVRTVLPHELFHLVQDAYDAEMDRWWAEGTAQWATKQLYPDLLDLERFLPAYIAEPWRSLDAPPGGVTAAFLYGTAIWPVFLSERHGAVAIREVFEGLAASDAKVLAATEAVLGEKGTTLADEFLTFAAWNAATGVRQGSSGYPEGASYPMVDIEDAPTGLPASIKGISSGLGAFYVRLGAGPVRRVALDTDEARNAAMVVPLEGGKARLDRAALLPAEVSSEAIVVVAGRTALKTDAPFTIRVDELPNGAGGAGGQGAGTGAGGEGEIPLDASGGSCACTVTGGEAERAGLGASWLLAMTALSRRRASMRRRVR